MSQHLGKHTIWVINILSFIYVGCVSLRAQTPPKSYTAYQTSETIIVDGKADEPSWHQAAWSSSFIDIEGVKKPIYDTQIKILWGKTNIYFLAKLEDPHVWGNLKKRDTTVYHNNAFEIFIDPDGDTHNYYEYQMNALNTVWDLFLSKPYRNGGKSLDAWNFNGMQSALTVQGTLNDTSDIDKGWTIEIAIPWSSCTKKGNSPPENEYWRINFSRVYWDFDLTNGKYSRKVDEKTGETRPPSYWVWSPHQEVNLHQPEKWGYVFFSSEIVGNSKEEFILPKDEHIKWYLYDCYRELIDQNNPKTYWKNVEAGNFKTRKEILGQFIIPVFEKHSDEFTIWVGSPFTNDILTINKDGKFKVIVK